MKFGLQNSVMGWDDPWYPDASRTLMRTGEGQFFVSQDPAPTKQAFIRLLQETFGVDFLMQHAMPQDERTEDFVWDMEKCGLQYMLGNEFGNINGPHCEGTNRYDVPQKLVRRAKRSENFLGLLYDETEHLQLHPSVYRKDARLHQWLTTPCKTEEECEEAIVNNVKRLVDGYGTDVYGECVFPSMMHLLARGGMHLSPKALKEEYQSVMFAVAMGACKQYKRKMCVTVDLWGFDVGEWFTRLWGFPAHGVQEFYNALVLSWYMSPELLFVENCDPLAISRGDSFEITPFGEAYRLFLERYRGKTPPYSHSDVQCEIAVIHADDGVFSANGTFDGAGSYGFSEFPMNERKNSFFQVMHALSHGAVSPAGTLLLVKPITAFQLGEGYAQSMGMNVKLFRLLIILLSSLLSACVVAFAGPVSFVGIAVPHLTKLLFNSSKPAVVLPGTFLLGAVFCLVCDLIARTIFAPTELAIGTVTAIFGAPVVIAMLLKSRRKSV